MSAAIERVIDRQKIALVGIVLGIALSLSPIPTFIDIAIHSKSTGGYTVAPYISSLLCSSLWLTYALMAGSAKSDMIPLNAISFGIYFIYCGIFLFYTPERFKTLRIYMATLAVLAGVVLVGIFTQSLIFVGIMATVGNCLMFAAPLMVMQLVVRTQSVRYMPLLLSLSAFLCASVWLLWAIVVNDYFVLIPNALGAFFGLVQLILYAFFWNKEKKMARTSEDITRDAGRLDQSRGPEEQMTPMRKLSKKELPE
jgi:solute carrier family 50 protein (sugar transporter)